MSKKKIYDNILFIETVLANGGEMSWTPGFLAVTTHNLVL